MPAEIQRQITTFGATITDPLWLSARPEVLCLVRQMQPTTAENARSLLNAARGLVKAVSSEQPVRMEEVLTTVNIEQYLRGLGHKTATNRRPLLLRLMSVAHGLPAPTQPCRRRRAAQSRPQTRPASLSASVADWMQQAQSGIPVTEVLHRGCTPDILLTMSPHLPAGDIPTYREVLRG